MAGRFLGNMTVGAVVPAALTLQLEALAELTAKLEAAISAQLSFTLTPPSLTLSLKAALDLVVSLEAAIALGLPGIEIDISIMASIIAALQLQVDLMIELGVALGKAGVLAFVQEGVAGSLGSDLQAVVNQQIPADQPTQALLLVATVPAVWAAMGKILITG
jgi:hypothetical protein